MNTGRILMTADAVGGVWTYALDLARAFHHGGIQTALAIMGSPPSECQRAEAACIPSLQLYESSFKLEWMDEPWDDVECAGPWLLAIEKEFRPDVIHLNGYAHATLPWQAPKLVVGHSCVLSWWRAVHGEPAPPSWRRYEETVARGLHAADLVAAPTHAMMNALEFHYGPLPRRVVIPNGRDPAAFQSGPKQELILTAGRLWDRAKNIEILDRVAPRLTWPVSAAGTGDSANLHMLGQLASDVLAAWLARTSIYVLPARYEPFGLSVLEAALSGCALVLGDIPSLRENWNGAAVFVPPDDESALVDVLNMLICWRPALLELQEVARDRALQLDLTSQRMAAAYFDCYRTLTR